MDLAIKNPDKYIECCEDLDLELMSNKSFEVFAIYFRECDQFSIVKSDGWSPEFINQMNALGIFI